jgi:hypothetical protein
MRMSKPSCQRKRWRRSFISFFPAVALHPFFNNSIKHVKKANNFFFNKRTFSIIMDRGQGSIFFKAHPGSRKLSPFNRERMNA